MTADSLYAVEVQYNVRLPTRDGLTLSANLFRPVPRAPDEKFPALLEMIPYRKDDWRYPTDHRRMTYFAQRGYVGCRLDVRGTGSSDGLASDEYTPQETLDGWDAVEWLAAQPWCSGRVGMWGISYGGFTSIQVAKLQPPHLRAIIPMYATDDRYLDDVHYLGGCLTASEMAQYAVAQITMNALPPKADYLGERWAEVWKQRLEQTPPWLLEWLRRQTDGPYWRSGSLAPDYERLTCAVLHIGGWMDGYTNPVLRMQARCTNAPRKALIGNWVHSLPDSAYPGPNLDYLHEMRRFFDHWLKGVDNGVMDEPALTYFRREYTPPEAFPVAFNGRWVSEAEYPPARTKTRALYLGAGRLEETPGAEPASDAYPHRPTLGTRAGLCWGAGVSPNGLWRDLRPDEALSLAYTSDPLDEPLDILGFPQAHLHLSSSAPVAHVVVRLTDVAPEGSSSQVTAGVLNLTHRGSHSAPEPLSPGKIYEVRVELKACGYRFLPGHRIRLSVASAAWPAIFPSPYPAENRLHRGPAHLSHLLLPVVPPAAEPLPVPGFKTNPPELIEVGGGHETRPVWEIVEDVLAGSVTVRVADGDVTDLPDRVRLATEERLTLTAYTDDPGRASLYNEVDYQLEEPGCAVHVRTSGTLRLTATTIHADVELTVKLNGNPFFHKTWLESIPRQLF